jgi:hypothetical protein
LGAQLRLEALVLQREPGRGADGFEEAGLVEEVAIVHEHGEPVTDVRDGAGTIGRETDLASVLVCPHAAVGQPEAEDERRIAKRPRQRRSHVPGLDLAQLDNQVRHRRARPPCQPQTERGRRRGEPDRDVPDVPEPPLEKRLSVEHVDEDVDVLEGVHHDEHGEERYEPASRTGTGTDQPGDEYGGDEE